MFAIMQLMNAPDEKFARGDDALLVTDTGLAALRIEGGDATAFLNAQATAEFADDADEAPLATLADAKGRGLAVFYAWRENDARLLALAASEVEWLCEHLARFVFRSRVRIAPAPDVHLLGVSGAQATAALANVGLPAPGRGQIGRAGPLVVARLAGERWLVAGEEMASADAARALAPHVETGAFEDWKRERLLAGEVEIRAETRARFLPQMLGLVELGAVSFRKGCFPGQEIIARTEHRGRVKRGLSLFKLDSIPEAGAKIELDDTRIEILDSVALPGGGALVQAVAPAGIE